MNAKILLIGYVAIIWMAAAMVQKVRAEEPTQEVVLEQCKAVVGALSEGIKGIKQHVMTTCNKGGTFTAVDSDGNKKKFYCSEVIEL
tara:strand:+ start:30447 stop:30707 length:261 start_codon:yes stop_codon:yes gene_type:complete